MFTTHKPQFLLDAQQRRSSNPGFMHLRGSIPWTPRYSPVELEVTDDPGAEDDWAELEQLIEEGLATDDEDDDDHNSEVSEDDWMPGQTDEESLSESETDESDMCIIS